MFRGVSQLNLDAKGRLAMPARYRDELVASCDGQLVVTVHPDRCLLVYPRPEWERVEQNLMSRPNLKPAVVRLQRLLVGHASDCELDGNGRLLLPQPLRKFAGMDKQVALLGQGKKFEIWDQATWDQRCEEMFEDGIDTEELESISL
ncbi:MULTISPECIES: division/cell wall cluster transcriptional repressor MraZ [unclassified Thioalkalivibrio]|uniref:division/cell wall cluster transcriptional repressor MraZ n=1 Tax=unclassified Thioalkalivibrio TaxID=2621013 RepID=UPI00036160E6|nr:MULTISPECIES: division/cell wall cluster transcriptional repressor MraZ [unclassified Thioalkalivibrio]